MSKGKESPLGPGLGGDTPNEEEEKKEDIQESNNTSEATPKGKSVQNGRFRVYRATTSYSSSTPRTDQNPTETTCSLFVQEGKSGEFGEGLEGEKRYTPIERIGNGSFGTVWKVQSLLDRKEYALKRIRVSGQSSRHPNLSLASKLNRLQGEIKAMMQIRHKGIVGLHDWFYDDARSIEEGGGGGEEGLVLCLVQELLNGNTLLRWALDNRRPLFIPKDCDESPTKGRQVSRATGPTEQDKKRLLLVWELAEAIRYMHSQGVLHNDLKPDNILIESSSGRLAVADFGLSGGFYDTRLIGAYRAPEVLRVPDGRLDYPFTKASDLWSLALVCVDIILGCERSIFQLSSSRGDLFGEMEPLIRTERIKNQLESVESGLPVLAPFFARALPSISRMLADDPQARGTSGDFLQALDVQYCSHLPHVDTPQRIVREIKEKAKGAPGPANNTSGPLFQANFPLYVRAVDNTCQKSEQSFCQVSYSLKTHDFSYKWQCCKREYCRGGEEEPQLKGCQSPLPEHHLADPSGRMPCELPVVPKSQVERWKQRALDTKGHGPLIPSRFEDSEVAAPNFGDSFT